MIKKMLMMILLLGVISVSGCHTAERATVRAGYYDSYPYGIGYVDPYARYYSSPYPAYFYDPYPYFFFGSDFFFFNPNRRIIILDNDRFDRPRRSLRGGGGRRGGGGFNSGNAAPGAPAPSPSPAPGSRNLR
jgi:hypothetical protein